MNDAASLKTRTIDLAGPRLVALAAPRGCIRVVHGSAWLTVPGEPRDVFLAAGDEWCLNGREVVIGAAAPARVQIAGAIASEGALARGWRRFAGAARRQVLRMQMGPAGVQGWR